MSTLIRKIEKNDLKKVIEMLSENISKTSELINII